MSVSPPTIGTTFSAESFAASLRNLTAELAANADEYDATGRWPERNIEAFGAAGGWCWGLPESVGGLALSAAYRLQAFSAVAQGDMSTALYVTQHEGAAELVLASPNEALRRRVGPRLARGEQRLTIGYSQLTTSHQEGPPALRAMLTNDEIVLDGFMPWVTGAPNVDAVTAGAVLPSGEQIIALVPLDGAGLTIEPAMELLAVGSTLTCAVRCENVRVPATELVLGPEPEVLVRRSGLRGLAVSACAIGLLRAIAEIVRQQSAKVPSATNHAQTPGLGLLQQVARFELELARLASEELHDEIAACDAVELRVALNEALIRNAAVMMTVAKGRGFATGQPFGRQISRLYREASFFGVWSASEPVRAGTINALMASCLEHKDLQTID